MCKERGMSDIPQTTPGICPIEDDIRRRGAEVREEIRRGEFSPEMIAAAKAALERLKAREHEDIEAWADRLARESIELGDD
jgi:hypothetical protein